MQIPKPTTEDIGRFRALVPDDPRIEVKPMFGNLGAFVNGNMFLGLFGPDIGVKLAPEDAEQLLEREGSGPFGPAERPMGGWAKLPASMLGTDEASEWASRSLEFVASAPPKRKK